jgi:hypothetical protein
MYCSGERARNFVELKASIDQLDEQCEKVVAAIRQIPGANAEREEPEPCARSTHQRLSAS